MKTQLIVISTLFCAAMFSHTGFAQGEHCASSIQATTGDNNSSRQCNPSESNSADAAQQNAESKPSAMNQQRMGRREHGGGRGNHGKRMKMSHDRHHFVRNSGVPAPYKGLTNPLGNDEDNFVAGKLAYTQNCATCHGDNGVGDGAGGKTLNPTPTNIARFAQMRMATDDYLFWTIAEGGAVVESDMPAFKDTLAETQIWQTIIYLRELSPGNRHPESQD